MPTRDDYERLIRHALKPGERVLVEMENLKDYNAQRMTLFRVLNYLKAHGLSTDLIKSRKTEIDGRIYLDIEHLENKDPVFKFITKEGPEERPVPRELPTLVDEQENNDFESWVQDAREFIKGEGE